MEPMKLTVLGNSGAVPQKKRAFTSTILSYKGKNIMFDCPEGNQKQLMKSSISLMKVNYIFISHLHADHFLGLFGWIATMTLNQRSEKLTIFSPRGGKKKIQKILREVVNPSFEIEFKEIRKGIILKEEGFFIRAFPLKHEIPCYGFVFKEDDKKGAFDRKKAEKLGIPSGPLYSKLVEGKTISVKGKKFSKKDVFDYSKGKKGRKVVVVMDTRPVRETIQNSKNAELLVHEATFLDSHKEKAIESFHTTAKEAGEIAKKASVKKLLLTHFSARIDEVKEVMDEVQKEFKNTIILEEGESINIE